MSVNKIKTDVNNISKAVRDVVAIELGRKPDDLSVISVRGGYSRNRRSIVGCGDKWLFAKEVDLSLLPDDGKTELEWLRKDYEVAKIIRQKLPELVPEWNKLELDGHVLLMPCYRDIDGWMWTPPVDKKDRSIYIQAVIDEIKKLESVKFDSETIKALNFQPYFRDKLAKDDGNELIFNNEDIRKKLEARYLSMSNNKELVLLRPAILRMSEFLKNKKDQEAILSCAKGLEKQPNDCFGHCDVRSDNIAYHPATGEIKLVDWNWASFVTSKFGSTEFLVDMARRGTDVSPWAEELNPELLAAMIGFYAKRCLEEPFSPESKLREMQAETAAISLILYDIATGKNH